MTIPTSDQSVNKVHDALIAACCTIFGATLDPQLGEYAGMWNDGTEERALVVVETEPGTYMPTVIIAVGTDVRQPIERPTLGPNRSREIDAEIDIVISVAIPGNATAARTARHTAAAAADLLALYFRQSGNETLAGSCREAWVSRQVGPKVTRAEDDEGVWGRVAEITATVKAKIRN